MKSTRAWGAVRLWLALGAIVVAALLAYRNSLSAPLLLDDTYAVVNNRSIRNLRDVGAVLMPPNDLSTSGRPLLNLSFALNYAIGGTGVRGYHVVNLVLHVLAACVLFGLLREVFRAGALPACVRNDADGIALAAALLWALHPLHTASVTYISQRAEVLMGLCYLLTLFGFVRALTAPRRRAWWFTGSFVACALGMLTKETMVTAPVFVLLLDRCLFARTWRDALHGRRGYYGVLAGTWLVVGALILQTQIANRGVGYETGVSPWSYALTQAKGIGTYAKLAFWPAPLVFDYGPEVLMRRAVEAAPWVLAHGGCCALAVWLWRRNLPLGFALIAFYLLLAPTSSIVPIAFQPMAENRMYLPAAVLAAASCAWLAAGLGRHARAALCLLIVAAGVLTARRNEDFSSAVALWSDTTQKQPGNVRAHNQLATALLAQGDAAGATRESEAALRLDPGDATAHNNLGAIYERDPVRQKDALAHYEAAARRTPQSASVQCNLGGALMRVPGREAEAETHLREAIRLESDYAKPHVLLGDLLLASRRDPSEAIEHYRAALGSDPNNADAHVGLGIAFSRLGRQQDAGRELIAALQLDPANAVAHLNLGNTLLKMPGGVPNAIAHYRRAVELQPALAEGWCNLGVALLASGGSRDEALTALHEALRLQPNLSIARETLEQIGAKE